MLKEHSRDNPSTALSKAHPLTALIAIVGPMLITLFVSEPVVTVASLLGALLFCYSSPSTRLSLRECLFFAAMLILLTVSNPLFSDSGETLLLSFRGLTVTAEALLYGANTAAAMVAVILWCRALTEALSSDRFVFLFGRLLPHSALVLTHALRLLPLFGRRAEELRDIASTSGRPAARGALGRLQSASRSFIALIGLSLEDSLTSAASMRARGYGSGRSTRYSAFKFGRSDLLLTVPSLMLFVTVLTGCALGLLNFEFYPTFSFPELGSPRLLCLSAFSLLSLLPFIFEIKEVLKWRFLLSRI